MVVKFRHRLISLTLVLCVILGTGILPVSAAESENCYYVSSEGNDENDGKTPETAWKSIEKVNSMEFQPGDKILFEGGETFTGTLEFDENDSGEEENYVEIGSYGEGRAIIYSGKSYGVKIVSAQYFRVKNLDFAGAGRLEQVEAKDEDIGKWVYYTISGIWIDNCQYVEVDGSEVTGYQHAGVDIVNSKDIDIRNVYAHQNGYMGIGVDYPNEGIIKDLPEEQLYSQRIRISNCQANDNPGDYTITTNHSGNGILLIGTQDSVVEYCEAANNGYDMGPHNTSTGGPVGMWIVNDVSTTTFQYNVSHNNKSSNGIDGGGFDLDGRVYDNIFQYNYSYDNRGAGYQCIEYTQNPTNWNNNVIRYNISENDEVNMNVLWNTKNCYIYNNTFYNSEGRFNVSASNLGVLSTGYYFWNNIFYNTRGDCFARNLEGNSHTFQNNAYYALNGEFNIDNYTSLAEWRSTGQEMLNGEPVGYNIDPMLRDPGFGEKITDPNELSSMSAYKLQDGSPMINSGIDVQALFGDTLLKGFPEPANDFAGNELNVGGYLDIGAYENPNGTDQEPYPVDTEIPTPPSSENLVQNPGFEESTGEPAGWSRWAPNGEDVDGCVVQEGDAYAGQNALLMTKNVYLSQTLKGIPNGVYTFKARIKRQGLTVNMTAKNYGGEEVFNWIDSPDGEYVEKTISNIVVKNGQCELGFFGQDANGTNSMLIDEVEFYRTDSGAPVVYSISNDVRATSASMTINSSEAGTGYYCVLPVSAEKPEASEVVENCDGSFSVKEKNNVFSVEGMYPETAYRVYVVVVDEFGTSSKLLTIPLVTPAAQNYVKNPSFEESVGEPKDWGRWADPIDEIDGCVVESGDAHSGDHALVMTKPVSLTQVLSVPNGTYNFTAWIKNQGMTINMTASEYGGEYRFNWIDGTNDSEYVQVSLDNIEVTNGSCKIEFYGQTREGARVQIDDVQFYNVDTTSPQIQDTGVENIVYNAADLVFTASEAGKYYYIICPEGAKAPSVSEVLEQQTEEVHDSGTVAAGENRIEMAGLSESTIYTVYLVMTDNAGNPSALMEVPFETPSEIPDTEPPQLTQLQVQNITSTTGEITFVSNERGTYYYLVYEEDQEAPSAETVLEQGTAVTKGSSSIVAGEAKAAMFSLPCDKALKAYIVLVDRAGNRTDVYSVPFKTKATPVNQVSNPGFEDSTDFSGGWRLWSGNGESNYDASNVVTSGAHGGGNAVRIYKPTDAFSVYTCQDVLDIPNGTYTLKVWIKRDGLGVNIEAKEFNNSPNYNDSYKNLNLAPAYSAEYELFIIDDIEVENNKCVIGFSVSGDGNEDSLYIDDVELVAKEKEVQVTELKIKEQPRLQYNQGEKLDLSALVLEAVYSDSSIQEIPFSGFASYGITTSPANGTELSKEDHHGASVKISLGNLSVDTQALSVSLTGADYTKVEEAIRKAESLIKEHYVDFSQVEAAVNAVVRGLDSTQQAEVDAMAKAIEEAIAGLEYKSADYSKVDQAIAKAESLDPDRYEDFSAVQEAIEAVVRNKNITEQAEVDAMAKAIEEAIAGLEYKSADYSKVDQAIAKAESLDPDRYEDFSAVQEAIEAVVRNKNITEQAEVDAMAQAIEDAIASLKLKTETSEEEENTSDESTSSSESESEETPATGDKNDILLVWALVGFACIMMATLVVTQRKKC